MARVKHVRVTNPSIQEIPGMMIQPAKTVAAFGVGAAVGNLALTPVTNAIDERLTENWQRGAAKLGAATAVLTLIAVATEKAKTKPRSENKVLITAAGVGSVSRLITTGIDDLMGRSEADGLVIDAEIVEEDEGGEEMGAILDAEFFDNLDTQRAGGSSMGSNRALFDNSTFNAYQ